MKKETVEAELVGPPAVEPVEQVTQPAAPPDGPTTFIDRIDSLVRDLEALKPAEKDTHQIMLAVRGLHRLRGVFEYLDK